MKRYLCILAYILIALNIKAQSQIDRNFWIEVKLNRASGKINNGLNSWLYVESKNISNGSSSKALERLERIDKDLELQDKLCLNLYVQYGRNKENLRQILKLLCGSYSVANPFSDILILKYSKDMRAKKLLERKDIENKEIEQRRENERREIEMQIIEQLRKDSLKQFEDYKSIEVARGDTVLPQFKNGKEGLLNFIKEHIEYPEMAQDEGVRGTVLIFFVISEYGLVENIDVIEGIGAGCDQEAKRVIRSMPKWIPAKANGKPIRFRMSLRISFGHSSKE